MDDELRRYFGKQLRRLFYRSPVRREALKRLPLRCMECQESFPKNMLDVDHMEPVVPTDRPVSSLEYFMRLFCYDTQGQVDLTNLVLLCKSCHHLKSAAELKVRAENKQGPYSAEALARRRATNSRKKKKR